MATAITYDGVQGAKGGGNIFQGKRFWVAQRIPMRSRFVGMIKENGGIISPLEKNADFLIADHIRKDAPRGSFSWQLIEDSMKSGYLQLEDKYRIGPDPDSPRPAGAGSLGKKSRAAFTNGEDAMLTQYVLSHTTDRTGNAIYQRFEALHPTHTWQSWRNRWIKTLKNRSQESLEALARTVSADTATRPQPDPQSPVPQPPQSPSLREPAQANISRPLTRENVPPEPDTQSEPESAPYPEAQESLHADKQEVEPQHENHQQQEWQHGDDQQPDDQDGVGFYYDLMIWARQHDVSIEIKPTVAGKQFELIDLGEAVSDQDVAPEDIDWNQVATNLGYERVSREVAGALQRCWEDNLHDFLFQMAEKQEAMDQIEEAWEMEEDDEIREDIVEAHVPQATLPSSPPAPIQNLKRSHEEDVVISRPKRQRLDRNAEIPSTPDHELRTTRRARQDDSPSLRRRHFTNVVEVKDSQDDTQATLGNPRTPNMRRSMYESQVARSSNVPQLGNTQSSFDITPSQQLRHEDRLSGSPEVNLGGHVEPLEDDSSSESPIPQSDLGTRSDPQDQVSASPSVRPKPVRRSLPESWTRQLQAVSAQSRQPEPQTPTHAQSRAIQQRSRRPPSPDSHDPANDPDPRPRRDSPNFDTIEGWVEHYQAMGYSHQHVVKALKCTTMTPGGEASHVMESLKTGKGIPTHTQGVWTTRDDKALRDIIHTESGGELDRDPQDAFEYAALKTAVRETKRLTHKHGEDGVELRKQFLEAQDQAALT